MQHDDNSFVGVLENVDRAEQAEAEQLRLRQAALLEVASFQHNIVLALLRADAKALAQQIERPAEREDYGFEAVDAGEIGNLPFTGLCRAIAVERPVRFDQPDQGKGAGCQKRDVAARHGTDQVRIQHLGMTVADDGDARRNAG